MKSIFNAIYVIIFINFVRKFMDKLRVPMEHMIEVESRDNSGEYYVVVSGEYFTWEDSREDALLFCWCAIAKCRSLSKKMKIVEHSEEHVLVAAESIPLLTEAEVDALNDTVDELG